MIEVSTVETYQIPAVTIADMLQSTCAKVSSEKALFRAFLAH